MKRYNWEEDRFYSISEDEERLYSTGDSELDDMLEKAFCDGYVYAQREFVSAANVVRRNDLLKMYPGRTLNEARSLKNASLNKMKVAAYEPTPGKFNGEIDKRFQARKILNGATSPAGEQKIIQNYADRGIDLKNIASSAGAGTYGGWEPSYRRSY